jgi:hypothetical protein
MKITTGIAERARTLRRWIAADRKNQAIALGSVLVVVALAVTLPITLSSSTPRRLTEATATTTTTKKMTVAVPGPNCPLTDTPALGVKVIPNRPALLVKIGNEPDGARPQSGLNEADIVFDTPAEGFIMRYVAVYQCESAPSIGPTRSARWVDWNMVAPEFGHPILAFAGGINPNVDGLAAEPWLIGANLLEGAQNAGHRISSRLAPDNLYTSTSAILSLFPSAHTPPQPIFDFAAKLPSGSKPAASIAINFSYGTDVVWKWSATEHQWIHTYAGATDIDAATGKPVTTTNVVVEIVHYQLGPYCESGCPGGSGDVESNLVGSGSGYVLRDGREFPVTWHRLTVTAKTTFTDAAGQEVALAPGRTWVEIVEDDMSAPVVTP